MRREPISISGRPPAALTIRAAAEATALGLAREALIGADPYEAAAALEAAETQLETLYTLTARISRLSLVNFLR